MLSRYDREFLVNVLQQYKRDLGVGLELHNDIVISERVDKAIIEYGMEWCDKLIEYFEKENNK